MIKNITLLFLLFQLVNINNLNATHIVGGEINLKYEGTGYTYKLSLNLYFDDVYGSPNAEDPNVNISIYSKKTNGFIKSFYLPKASQTQVPYTNNECSSSFLKTRQIHYETSVFLDPEIFAEEEGYYMVWERCCRNNQINNIVRPDLAGMVFYLHIPPVKKDEKHFINNSPDFSLPKGDYACINQPFVFEFGATDEDGDQLKYSLATPLNGFSNANDPMPSPLPGPYPTVNWADGLNLDNLLPATDPVKVNATTGQITFTSNFLGLYVFSILCEEFRNGDKIGEVRRDFQILVIDCPDFYPPSISLINPQTKQQYQEGEIIELGDTNGECLNFTVTDSSKSDNITVQLIPENFPADWVDFQRSSGWINGPEDTLSFQSCWNQCAHYLSDQSLKFKLVASDLSCPVPKYDTINVTVFFKPLNNNPPKVSTDLPNNKVDVTSGSTLNFSVLGIDEDADKPVSLHAITYDFDLKTVGMTFSGVDGFGSVSSNFSWTPDCKKLQDGNKYVIDFVVKGISCDGLPDSDTVRVELTYKLKLNNAPRITSLLDESPIKVYPGQEVVFELTSSDPNGDPITLWAEGSGFNLNDQNMIFAQSPQHAGKISGIFEWKPLCENTTRGFGLYTIFFITKDDACPPSLYDTLSVILDLTAFDDTEYVFKPYNVFSPNGDDKNPYFMIPEDELPADNCINRFINIEIFNRWGSRVFFDESRDFKWSGEGASPGVYYYIIRYSEKEWKGTVSLLR